LGRSWSAVGYQFTVPTYPHVLPTAGGRLFFTGVGVGSSAERVGFLTPLTGAFQAVGGLDTNRRDQGASFFVPNTQGRKVMVAGGGGATTALIDLYSSPKPVYRPGPPLSGPRRYLSHATLFDGRVLLAARAGRAGPAGYYYLVAMDSRACRRRPGSSRSPDRASSPPLSPDQALLGVVTPRTE
jgi:hypothetical protein